MASSTRPKHKRSYQVTAVKQSWKKLHAGLTREYDVDEVTIRDAILQDLRENHTELWAQYDRNSWYDVVIAVVPSGDYGRKDCLA